MNMANRRNKGSSLIDKVLTPCSIHLEKLLGTVLLLLYVFPEIGSQYSADVSKGKLMRHKVQFINCLFTARKRSLRMLCFHRCLSVHRKGVRGGGQACVVGAGMRGVCGREACVVGDMHGGGCAWHGACMAEGACWACGACMPPPNRYYEIWSMSG